MDNFEEIRSLRDEYEVSLDEVEKRRAAYHRAIQKLHLSGMPLREIAEGLGVSHQRVHQIVTGETAASKRRGRVTKGIAAASVLALTLGGGYLIGREVTPPIAAPASPRPSPPAETLSSVDPLPDPIPMAVPDPPPVEPGPLPVEEPIPAPPTVEPVPAVEPVPDPLVDTAP